MMVNSSGATLQSIDPMETGGDHRNGCVATEMPPGQTMLDRRNSCLRFLRHLDELASREGLTSTQWMILDVLAKEGDSTVKTLAARLVHDAGAMTRVLDVLEAKGLIKRRRCGADRRILFAMISASGKTIADRLNMAIG
ncbi:MarR family transcriptional regulator [Sphingomonas sp. CFBP8993]|uniref:MarR family winged helix-turn-helix transcriptional regulator n=1 Tax=Sphingomonas sp. CFBP8993 TaxID=3096526 RepID=UPI002A69DB28|nr:MarR family transcriptional regulator [Sphingomonas sp. CFBP8993]MDY0960482.1 MarR family transcriptional regulator [Sphingomonas sp. CFBP8993]